MSRSSGRKACERYDRWVKRTGPRHHRRPAPPSGAPLFLRTARAASAHRPPSWDGPSPRAGAGLCQQIASPGRGRHMEFVRHCQGRVCFQGVFSARSRAAFVSFSLPSAKGRRWLPVPLGRRGPCRRVYGWKERRKAWGEGLAEHLLRRGLPPQGRPSGVFSSRRLPQGKSQDNATVPGLGVGYARCQLGVIQSPPRAGLGLVGRVLSGSPRVR